MARSFGSAEAGRRAICEPGDWKPRISRIRADGYHVGQSVNPRGSAMQTGDIARRAKNFIRRVAKRFEFSVLSAPLCFNFVSRLTEGGTTETQSAPRDGHTLRHERGHENHWALRKTADFADTRG